MMYWLTCCAPLWVKISGLSDTKDPPRVCAADFFWPIACLLGRGYFGCFVGFGLFDECLDHEVFGTVFGGLCVCHAPGAGGGLF